MKTWLGSLYTVKVKPSERLYIYMCVYVFFFSSATLYSCKCGRIVYTAHGNSAPMSLPSI